MLLIWKQTGQLILEFLLDVVRFPWWWYSDGLKQVASYTGQAWARLWVRVGLGVFLKYFFKPMYQDYSWQGRLISLTMRLFLLVVKLTHIILIGLLYLVPLLGWIVLLPVSLLIIFND